MMEMANYHETTFDDMANRILQWNYDDITSTYLLLLQQKQHGKTPTIAIPKFVTLVISVCVY